MGTKTAVLAYADASVTDVLQPASAGDSDRLAGLVAQVRPGQRIDGGGEESWELIDALYPPEGTVCALSVRGLDIVCDREIMIDRPSELPGNLAATSQGTRLYLHTMHSVVDWLAFAIWEDGQLTRSLSVSPDRGIIEDIGERLAFELPYWSGRHPVEPDPSFEDEAPYPLPFHPLDLGERALLEFFGFSVEGCSGADSAEPVMDISGITPRVFRMTRVPKED